MTRLILLYFVFAFATGHLYAQDEALNSNDTLFDSGIFVSASIYSFAYTPDLKNGSTAVGASWFFNDPRINLQLAIMVDLKKYYEWQRGGHFDNYKEERISIFFPILLHYNYLRFPKTVYFFSLGIAPGTRFIPNEFSNTSTGTGGSVCAGTGISRYINKRLYGRVSFNTHYLARTFSPGLSLDLVIPLKSRSGKEKNESKDSLLKKIIFAQ